MDFIYTIKVVQHYLLFFYFALIQNLIHLHSNKAQELHTFKATILSHPNIQKLHF